MAYTHEEKLILNTSHTDEEIKGFFDKYRFLSNFHLVDVEFEGMIFPSTENAFQAAKTLDIEERKKFQNISPKEAKELGKKVTLRPNWDKVKIGVMTILTLEKFTKNQDLKTALLNTGVKNLEETNWWGDKFWGVSDGEGKNVLGKLIMIVRSYLLAEHQTKFFEVTRKEIDELIA